MARINSKKASIDQSNTCTSIYLNFFIDVGSPFLTRQTLYIFFLEFSMNFRQYLNFDTSRKSVKKRGILIDDLPWESLGKVECERIGLTLDVYTSSYNKNLAPKSWYGSIDQLLDVLHVLSWHIIASNFIQDIAL